MSDYKIQLLQARDYKTTEWSGGTTTELSIAPEDSIYADRDFEWRLSSATVDVEESEFTALPDYNRVIMTLKGGIRLSHNKGEWLELPEFTPHYFDGGDSTVSVGKVIDFNLMLRKGVCTGEVVPYLMKAEENQTISEDLSEPIETYKVVMVYCYAGALTISLEDGSNYELSRGDAMKLTGIFTDAVWSCTAKDNVSAVVAAVRYETI
ncbi:MAG: HutD family protein [Clostridium sp.]